MNNKAKILSLLLFIMISITSPGQMKELDVPGVSSPAENNWCWARVVTEVSNYFGNNRQICEIVESARVNLINPYKDRGSVNCCSVPCPDSCLGPEWSSNIDNLLSFESIQASYNSGDLQLSSVIFSIEDDRPIIAHVTAQRLKDDGTCCRTAGHVMTIKGYNCEDLIYNDYGSTYITSYADAIAYECMGRYNWQWTRGSTQITSPPNPIPCPISLGIIENITSSSDIKAKSEITISSQIGNNITVNLKAGSSIILDNNFSIPLGSSLLAETSSNPCQ
jgi:hypothetical protein